MLPNLDIVQIIMLGAIAGGCYLAFKVFYKGGGKAPKKFTTPILLFTKRREIYEITVENKGTIMLPERGYGYMERVKSVIIYRFGRVKKKYSNPLVTENSRKRKNIYVVRENDPAPLDMNNSDNGYVGEPVTREELRKAENTNMRTATMMALQEGASTDATSRRLGTAVLVAVAVAGIAWVLVLVVKVGMI